MKSTFQHIWTSETSTHIPDESYHVIIQNQYRALQDIFDSELQPVTVVVTGQRGQGKTIFLRKAMLDWASEKLWQNRFQYVFFFSVYSLNSTTEISLADLISSKLPLSSETLNDILLCPKRILFILDGFDYLKYDLELRTNLCDDWSKKLPTQIVLSSLLQKIMLPESSLLLELGVTSVSNVSPLLQYPRVIRITGFSDQSIEFYCASFFNIQTGIKVFENLKRIKPLLELCSNPYTCWIICSTLKWQYDRGEEVTISGETESAVYTRFMMCAFKSTYATSPSKQNRARLKTLCTLALEGIWKQVFVFDSEDLRRNGISESDKVVWLRMKFLQNQGNNIVFYHPVLQWYFAGMFYFLRQDKDIHHPVIGSLPQLLEKMRSYKQEQWLHIGIFVFGIATEQVAALLEPFFGFISYKQVREEIMNYLKSVSQQKFMEKQVSPANLFVCLLENQEERFTRKVMDLFEEITVNIRDSDDLSAATYSLLQASKLKKLHLHIQKRVFSETLDAEMHGDVESFTQDKL